MRDVKHLGVFCGSSLGGDDRYREAAEALGTTLAAEGVRLVYGGAAVGLMGVVADACLARGGSVVGVIPRGLFEVEVPHHGLTELVEVASMHDRKQRMYELADAFVALPGGMGTLEELAEVLTWNQLGIHAKPLALVDIAGHWQGLLAWLGRAVDDGFLRAQHRRSVVVVDDVADALAALRTVELPRLHKWIDLDET